MNRESRSLTSSTLEENLNSGLKHNLEITRATFALHSFSDCNHVVNFR